MINYRPINGTTLLSYLSVNSDLVVLSFDFLLLVGIVILSYSSDYNLKQKSRLSSTLRLVVI